MPLYTIEMAYDVPNYRQHTYEAASLAEALALAKADDQWDDSKPDYDCASVERVTGAWAGDTAYRGRDLLNADRTYSVASDVEYDGMGNRLDGGAPQS